MSTITIQIHNKTFPIACEDGQEQLGEKAAFEIAKKFDHLKTMSPTASMEYLLLLCAISIQNELSSSGNISNNNNGTNDLVKIEKALEEIAIIIEEFRKKMKS